MTLALQRTYCERCRAVVEVRGLRCVASHWLVDPEPVPLPRPQPASVVLEMLGLEAGLDDFGLDLLEPRGGSQAAPAVYASLVGHQLDPGPEMDLGPVRMPTSVRLGRPRSWTRAALIGVAIAGLAVAGGLASRIVSDHRIGLTADQYLQATDDVTAVLPRLSDAAVQLADLSQSNLEEITGILNLAARQNARLQRTIEVPPPTALPFGDPGAHTSLELSADRLLDASQRLEAANHKLANAATYRAVFATAFQLPHLPDAIDPLEVPSLQRDLAVAVTRTQEAISRLPDDPLLQTHRSAAESQLQALRLWQADYLEALHRSDLVTAQQLRTQLDGEMAQLEAGLAQPLGILAGQLEEELAEVKNQLEVEMGALGA